MKVVLHQVQNAPLPLASGALSKGGSLITIVKKRAHLDSLWPCNVTGQSYFQQAQSSLMPIPNLSKYRKSFHKTWGRPVDSRLLSKLQPPPLYGFKLCSGRDEARMGDKKQTKSQVSVLLRGSEARMILANKKGYQEIIGVGKWKVTKASDSIIFLDSCSYCGSSNPESKWSSATWKLNAHHWLKV